MKPNPTTRARFSMPAPLLPLLLAFVLAGKAMAGDADPGQPLPAWEQLDQARRDILVAPLRERWNRNPDERARMYQRALRWQSMPPEQRARAHRGLHRWESMDPDKRAKVRMLFERTRGMPRQQRRETFALFKAMLDMTSAERDALRRRWPRMTPGERDAWLQAHGPRRGRHPQAPQH